MASDVDMVSYPEPEVIVVDDSRSPSPHHQEAIVIDETDSPVHSDQPSSPEAADGSAPFSTDTLQVVNEDRIAPAKEKKIKPTTLKPASTAGAKPKSKARSPSPSPPPPPIRPPLETVRLDIPLGGPDNYEVNVSQLSKDSGQRQATPAPPIKRDTSDDSHSEGDDEGDGKPKEKKRRRVSITLLLLSEVITPCAEEGIRLLRCFRSVYRRLGTSSGRANIFCSDEAAGLLRLEWTSAAT